MKESEFPKKFILSRDSKYFISRTCGGYSKYTNMRGKSLLPNCTGGAYGISMQICETTDYKKVTLPKAHAGAWYNNCKWEKGKEPRLGAVICWKKHGTTDGSGHVGIVTGLERDRQGNVTKVTKVLESSYYSYNKKDWREGMPYKYDKKTGAIIKSGYDFQGYLYNPNVELDKPEPFKVGDKVKIIARGNSRPDGKGKACNGISWKRYVIEIKEGAKFPYKVGFLDGRTTGWYKEEALEEA